MIHSLLSNQQELNRWMGGINWQLTLVTKLMLRTFVPARLNNTALCPHGNFYFEELREKL